VPDFPAQGLGCSSAFLSVSPFRFSSRIESAGPDPVFGFGLPLESSCLRSDLRAGPHPRIGSQFAAVAFCVVLLPSRTPVLTVAGQFRSSTFWSPRL
jgi:hypothetical protein